MSGVLAWALQKARQQTLTLVEDVNEEQMCLQAARGENHPAWTLGHLLLGDIYLLSLLEIENLSDDFSDLLATYGPGSKPVPVVGHYAPKRQLVERLSHTGALRLNAVGRATIEELAKPMPDEILARAQPTIAHHLQSLIFHEGNHAGQLAAWRKAQGFRSIKGAFAPEGF